MAEDKELNTFGFCPRLRRGMYCVVEFNYEDAYRLETGTKKPTQMSVEAVDQLVKDKKIHFYFRINVEEIEAAKYSDTVNIEDWMAENKNKPIKLGSKEFPYLLLQSISDSIEFDNPDMENSNLLFPEYLKEAQFFARNHGFVAPLEPLLECHLPTVMGVDVATESDKFAIVIIRPGTIQGNLFDNVVYAFAQTHMSYSDMLNKLYECIEKYNVVLFHMDKRGGGTALRDMLREPEDKTRPSIVDELTDPKAILHMNRVNMMRMVNATAEYNTTSANTIKAKMQAKKILIPRIVSIHPDPEMDLIYRNMLALRSQFGKIKSKPIGGGWKKY